MVWFAVYGLNVVFNTINLWLCQLAGGERLPYHELTTVALGTGGYVAAELLLGRFRRGRVVEPQANQEGRESSA